MFFPGGLQDHWVAYASPGKHWDEIPCSLWDFTSWASKCSGQLSDNPLASSASEIHGCILIKPLKQNAKGKCSEKWFEVFCSLVPKPCLGFFFPFSLLFQWEASSKPGGHIEVWAHYGSECLHLTADSEEVNLGTIKPCPVHSRFQGVCGVLGGSGDYIKR